MNSTEQIWREFGAWLKEQRDKLGLSQEGAGDKIGMTRQQWQRIESGISGTKRTTVERIAKGLKLDVALALDKAGFKIPKQEINGHTEIEEPFSELSFKYKKLSKKKREAIDRLLEVVNREIDRELESEH